MFSRREVILKIRERNLHNRKGLDLNSLTERCCDTRMLVRIDFEII